MPVTVDWRNASPFFGEFVSAGGNPKDFHPVDALAEPARVSGRCDPVVNRLTPSAVHETDLQSPLVYDRAWSPPPS